MTDKTDREIMQQSLEALDYISCRDYDDTPLHDYELAKMRPAMSTLRERLAQPEQKPVAYVISTLSSKSISDEIAPTGWSTFESKIEKLRADPWVQNGIAEIIPLYTSPPEQKRREWQGLFFDAVYEAWHSAGMDVLGGDWNTFASKLEEKLKETK